VIRAKCIDCSGGSESEARKCTAIGCALWPYRMASNPFRVPREVTQEQREAGAARLAAARAILLNEHVAEDGPTVFAHACRLGAEGIVSKKVDGTYRSGPCPVWIKVRNPASIAVQRERSEKWNR
jgi:hypothetical protein